MNILIAPDKFKYTFSATEIAHLIAKTAGKLGHNTLITPLSDGGEGFLEVIAANTHAIKIPTATLDPIFRPMQSYFLWDKYSHTAYMELALTGSLQLLHPLERNPLNTSTYGLGIQVKKALDLGAKKIYIGLGGSSTTDMGIGMAAALGYRFLDWQHNALHPIGRNLIRIQHINRPQLHLPEVIACVDVNNPLYGPDGAAFVYSPQKGASPDATILLDRGIRNTAYIVERDLGIKLNTTAGEGAAGGLGAGIRAFLNGQITSGTDFIFSLVNIHDKIQQADVVITGEGRFDEQSMQGKVTGRIIELAQRAGKKIIVIAGQSTMQSTDNVHIIALFTNPVDMDTAQKLTPRLLDDRLTQALQKIN